MSYDPLGDIMRMIRRLHDELVSLREEVHEEIKAVKSRISEAEREIEKRISITEDKVDSLREEVHEEIKAVKSRISEAEKKIELHLKKQDEILENNSEGLTNSLLTQFIYNVTSGLSEFSNVTTFQLDKTPIVIIEEINKITIIVITNVLSESHANILKVMEEKLRELTDKDIICRVLTTLMSTKEAIPIWTYGIK